MTTTAPPEMPGGAYFSPQTIINDNDTAIINSHVRQHTDQADMPAAPSGAALR
jgi:hypothetical protein